MLLTHAGVQLAHGALQTIGLRQSLLDRLTLRFEPGGLLHHGIGQRLERADLAADLVHRGLHAVHPAHGLLHARDATFLVGQLATQIVATAVQGLHLLDGQLVGIDEALVLLAQPSQLLAGPIHVPAHLGRLVQQILEGLVDLDERGELVLQRERRVDLAAHFLEQRPQAGRLFEGARYLSSRLLVSLDQLGRLLVQVLELLRQLGHRGGALLQLGEARRHRLHLGADLHVGLAELLQLVGGALHFPEQGFEAVVLLLHRGDDGFHFVGQLSVSGAVPEQVLEQGAHLTLLRTRRPTRPWG